MDMNAIPEYAFDPVSHLVITALPLIHKSHQRVSEAITSIATTVSSSTETGRTATRHGLSYEQFLAGLLYNEETMLVSEYMSFDHITFETEGESPKREQMTQGRAILTNHRIVLLSAEIYQGLSLTPVAPNAAGKPRSYTITGQASDMLNYVAIPLSGIYSAELKVSIGVKSNGSIIGITPCCCLACFSCCGKQSCLKQWSQGGDISTEASNVRILSLGVTMPPWGHKYLVQIHINPAVPLTLVKDIIVALNRFAPKMLTTAQKASI